MAASAGSWTLGAVWFSLGRHGSFSFCLVVARRGTKKQCSLKFFWRPRPRLFGCLSIGRAEAHRRLVCRHVRRGQKGDAFVLREGGGGGGEGERSCPSLVAGRRRRRAVEGRLTAASTATHRHNTPACTPHPHTHHTQRDPSLLVRPPLSPPFRLTKKAQPQVGGLSLSVNARARLSQHGSPPMQGRGASSTSVHARRSIAPDREARSSARAGSYSLSFRSFV
jgi:hypothetical protein